MTVLGWDIGGANLKASDGATRSVSRPFPLWRSPDRLADALRELAAEFPRADFWAVTMTGELADCFATKAEGVHRILEAVAAAVGTAAVSVWTTTGEFVAPEEACAWPRLAAAANWHALATWAGRMAPNECALLVDIGSTTTDIIPLKRGVPDPEGRTDIERLLSCELVYTGVRRTPVNTVAAEVAFRGGRGPLAAELFATMHDVYLLTGEIPEDPGDLGTADGRPATRPAAAARLARMMCCDLDECTLEELELVAAELAGRAQQRIALAAGRVVARLTGRFETILLTGEGTFLAEAALNRPESGCRAAARLRLDTLLGPAHSRAACAYALARLGGERLSIH